jgi:hypothetical protein
MLHRFDRSVRNLLKQVMQPQSKAVALERCIRDVAQARAAAKHEAAKQKQAFEAELEQLRTCESKPGKFTAKLA